MNGPTKHLPLAIGFGLEPGGGSSGGRAEAVTTDPGMAPRAAESSRPEPKEPGEHVAPAAAQVVAEPVQVYQGQEEDIDALHARFDAMEAYIKRAMTVVTLHARFDALEAYLKARLGG